MRGQVAADRARREARGRAEGMEGKNGRTEEKRADLAAGSFAWVDGVLCLACGQLSDTGTERTEQLYPSHQHQHQHHKPTCSGEGGRAGCTDTRSIRTDASARSLLCRTSTNTLSIDIYLFPSFALLCLLCASFRWTRWDAPCFRADVNVNANASSLELTVLSPFLFLY